MKSIQSTPTITDDKVINDILTEVNKKPTQQGLKSLENASKLLRKLRGY